MKKTYIEPETEALEIECIGMLCTSTGTFVGGDADEPAHAREYEEWID